MYLLLKHKNIDVAKIEYKNNSFKILEIIDKKHLPLGINSEYENIRNKQFENWFTNRSIPQDRQEIERIKNIVGNNLDDINLKALSLSLNDCYFIKKDNDNRTWEDINFYKNGFDNNFAINLLENKKNISSSYPDFTTNGFLKKFWLNIDNVNIFCKFGNLANSTQFGENVLSANEIISSKIAKLLNINHIEYFPMKYNNIIFSASNSFIKNDNIEFITAN